MASGSITTTAAEDATRPDMALHCIRFSFALRCSGPSLPAGRRGGNATPAAGLHPVGENYGEREGRNGKICAWGGSPGDLRGMAFPNFLSMSVRLELL